MDSHSPCTLYIVFYLIQYIWSIRIQADEYTCLRKESQFMYRKQTVYSYTGRNSVYMPSIILVLLVLFYRNQYKRSQGSTHFKFHIRETPLRDFHQTNSKNIDIFGVYTELSIPTNVYRNKILK